MIVANELTFVTQVFIILCQIPTYYLKPFVDKNWVLKKFSIFPLILIF